METSTQAVVEQTKTMQLVLENINKKHGAGTAQVLGKGKAEPWPSVSTGALSLDYALGIKGLPRGRIVEIYGPESSGKSTICLSVIAQAQQSGGLCAFIDAEHAIDPIYAEALGVNLDNLIFVQPDSGEAALDALDELVKSGEVAVIIVDSVAALTPQAEIDGDMSKQHMGLLPRLMAMNLRKITANAAKTQTTVIFTNQIREKIGVMFGNPETTPGGRALKFYASVRIDLRKNGDIKDKEGNFKGVGVKAKIIKNKMAPPLKIAEFDIVYGEGVDQVGCVVDLAIQKGVIKKSGAWLSDPDTGEMLGQGRDNTIAALKENPELLNYYKDKI